MKTLTVTQAAKLRQTKGVRFEPVANRWAQGVVLIIEGKYYRKVFKGELPKVTAQRSFVQTSFPSRAYCQSKR